MILLSVLFILVQVSQARDVDGGDRPARCNQAAVNACIAGHAAAMQRERERIVELTRLMDALRPEVQSLTTSVNKLSENINIIYNDNLTIQKETAYLHESVQKIENTDDVPVIFSGSPPLEKYFRLSAESLDWMERFPADRLNRLLRLQESMQEQKAKLDVQKAKFLNNLNDYAPRLSAAEQEYPSHVRAAEGHGFMCGNGCKNQICP